MGRGGRTECFNCVFDGVEVEMGLAVGCGAAIGDGLGG